MCVYVYIRYICELRVYMKVYSGADGEAVWIDQAVSARRVGGVSAEKCEHAAEGRRELRPRELNER